MTGAEVLMLWAYAKELWGTTFDVPNDPRARAVKEQVWLDVLGDLDAALVRRTMASSGLHFAPTPPELRRLAQERAAIESGEPAMPDYDQALAKLNGLVHRYGTAGYYRVNGAYTDPRPGPLDEAQEFHPALRAAIDAMGWQSICASENPEAFRAQFREVWRSVTSRHERERFSPPPLLAAVKPQVAAASGRTREAPMTEREEP